MKALKFTLVLSCFVAFFMSIAFADWSAESEGYCDWGVPIHAKTCDSATYADTAFYLTGGATASKCDSLKKRGGYVPGDSFLVCYGDTFLWLRGDSVKFDFITPNDSQGIKITGTVNASSGTQKFWHLNPTVNLSAGTANINGLDIDFDTTGTGFSGSGTDYLAIFGVDGNSKWQVDVSGNVIQVGDLTSGGNLKVDTINSKTTNGNLVLLPNGSGRTQIGDAYSVSLQSLGNDDLYITGKLEVRGSVYFGDSMFIPQWDAAPATGSPGLFGADSTNDSLITFIGGTRAVVYPHPSVAAVDSATYADTVYGQVGKSGSCIDAYLDSVFGCSQVVFSAPVKIDSSLTVEIKTATADTGLVIILDSLPGGSDVVIKGLVVRGTSFQGATQYPLMYYDRTGALITYIDGTGKVSAPWMSCINDMTITGKTYLGDASTDTVFAKGDIIATGNGANDTTKIDSTGIYTTGDLTANQGNFIDSLFIPQWAAAPGTGSSGLFGADTTNDSIIAFLGGTRAVIYPAAGGGGIAETLGVIEVDDTTLMTADNDTFRIATERVVKWEVDDASGEYWIAQEFKKISFGFDSKSLADYGSVWGGRSCYNSASYGTVVGGYYDSVKANWAFIAGGQTNKILTGTHSGIIGGQNNIIESGTHSGIVGGVTNKIDGGAGFIGGGTQNKIGNLAMYSGIVGGGNDSIGNGSNYCFIGSGNYNYISKGGDNNAICGGSYNLIGDGGTDNYNFIGGGHYDTLFADYSGIISGRKNSIQSNCRNSFIGAGYANKIRGEAGDSCNAAFGAGSAVDSCFASFAMNCAIKKADSTFGFSKQIWVIEGTDSTKITAQGIDFTYEDPTIKRGYGIVSTDVVFDTGNVTIVTADDGWVVEDVYFEVTTTFDGDAVVTIGDAGDADGYLRDADINQGVAAYYGYESDERGDYLYDATNSHSRQKIYTASTAIVIYVTQTTATQGAGTVYVGLKRLK